MIQFSLTGRAASVTDPMGDFDSPDITGITSEVKDGYLYLMLDFAENIEGRNCAGEVFLDTDGNPNTQYNEGTGADYIYSYNIISAVSPVISATLNSNMVGADTLSISGSQMFIAIPLSMLGNDDGDMNVFAASHSGISDLFFDRVPDYGVLNTMTGELSNLKKAEDFEWNFQDIVGDSSGSRDITEVKTRTHDDVLDIQITYENNVESNDVHGWVLIDSDQNIATGFANTGEVPPSFGIDYRLEYTTGPMLGTLANLKMESKETDTAEYTGENKGIPLGMPYNDAMFIASGNQVVFRLPLRLLNSDDGRVSFAVNSFPVKDFSGKIEKVPELEEGTLDTGTGRIRPLLVFTENPIVIDDPAGDSTGFGYDGDDLTSIEAGYSNNIMLLKITYTELKITDGAITTISFDTDQNAEQVPDYVVSYSFYNGKLGAQLFGEKEGKYGMHPAGNLISNKGNSVYVSIPLEFLQDEGNMEVYVETTLVSSKAEIPSSERGNYGVVDISPNKFENSVYDRLPDSGSISITKGAK